MQKGIALCSGSDGSVNRGLPCGLYNHGSIPGRRKCVSSCHHVQKCCWTHPASSPVGAWDAAWSWPLTSVSYSR